MKKCTKCKEEKPFSLFTADKSRKDGFYPHCKACVKVKYKNWSTRNKDHLRTYWNNWAKGNKDHLLNYNRLWRQNNPEADRASKRKWEQNNPDKVAEKTTKRRLHAQAAIPKWSEKDLIRTVYTKAKQFYMHVDHVVPLVSNKVCGLHVWSNLQLMCISENSSKGNREWPDMW